tara:strand:+ start:364 stop:507 length:144 start_codon:yes stop_codon:yes gene_type:complete
MSNENDKEFWDSENDTVVEASRPKLKKPRMYQVILLNDDYTPMEFVG